MNVDRIEFRGWNAIAIANNVYQITIPIDIGIRILGLSHNGDSNWLHVSEEDAGKKGEEAWRLYGGHRLWIAPEHPELSYESDNDPITWSQTENGILLIQKPGKWTGLEKQMQISFSEKGINLLHRIINRSHAPVKPSLWPITALRGEGRATLPVACDTGPGLNPGGSVILWPYTKMNDQRISWDASSLCIEHKPSSALKMGVSRTGDSCRLTYNRQGKTFSKEFRTPHGSYPDLGCVAQCYTNENLIELESLSPLTDVPPGSALEHLETWSIS